MVIQMLSVIITMVLGMAFILIYRAFSVLALGIYQGDYRWKSLLEIIFTGDRSENVIVRILFIFIICGIAFAVVFAVIRIIIINLKGYSEDGKGANSKKVAQDCVKAVIIICMVPVLFFVFNFLVQRFTETIYLASLKDMSTIESPDAGQLAEELVSKVIIGFTQNDDLMHSNINLYQEYFYQNKFISLTDALYTDTIGLSPITTFLNKWRGQGVSIWVIGELIGGFFGLEGSCYARIFNFQAILCWVVLIILIKGAGSGLLQSGKRLFDSVLLVAVMPLSASSLPFDEGKRTVKNIQLLLSKMLIGAGVLVAFNVYFALVERLGTVQVSAYWDGKFQGSKSFQECLQYMACAFFMPTSNEARYGIFGIVYIIIISMGAVSIGTAPSLFGSLISEEAGRMASEDASTIRSQVGGAVKTAGMLGLGVGAVGLMSTKAKLGTGKAVLTGLKTKGSIGDKFKASINSKANSMLGNANLIASVQKNGVSGALGEFGGNKLKSFANKTHKMANPYEEGFNKLHEMEKKAREQKTINEMAKKM